MTQTTKGPTSERIPSYVIECRRLMAKATKRQDGIVQRYLPATEAVNTLLGYFRRRLKYERSLLTSFGRRRMEINSCARFSPSAYVVHIAYQARLAAYAFLIRTLRMHAGVLGRRQDPERLKDPKRRHAERSRFWDAPGALAAVGSWWTDATQGPVHPYVTGKERKAFTMCARLYRLLEQGTPIGTPKNIRLFTAFLDWIAKPTKERK